MKRYIKSAVVPMSEISVDDMRDILTNEDASPIILEGLAHVLIEKEYYSTLKQMLMHPNISRDTIFEILPAVFKDPYGCLPKEFIDLYSDDHEIISYVAQHGDKFAQEYLAFRKDTPVDILEILADSPYPRVRVYVASNLNTPKSLLLKLTADKDYTVVDSVLDNDNYGTNPDIIMAILNAPPVYEHTVSSTSSHENVFNTYDWKFKFKNPVYPTDEILIKLATDESEHIRESIADWIDIIDIPYEVLTILANDNVRRVRKSLIDCGHPDKIPEDICIQLAHDADAEVREDAAAFCPLPYDTYMQLANDESRYVRINLTFNKYVPKDILRYLLNDPEEKIREHALAAIDRWFK